MRLVSLKYCRLTRVAGLEVAADRPGCNFSRLQRSGRSRPWKAGFQLVIAAPVNNIPSSRMKLSSPDVCPASPATTPVGSLPLALAPLLRERLVSSSRATTGPSRMDVAAPISHAETPPPVLHLLKNGGSDHRNTVGALAGRALHFNVGKTAHRRRGECKQPSRHCAETGAGWLVSEGRPPRQQRLIGFRYISESQVSAPVCVRPPASLVRLRLFVVHFLFLHFFSLLAHNIKYQMQ